jgi:hypothetical protein
MFGRFRSSLRELIRTQHGEFMLYQEKRDDELRRRDDEFRRRDEEMREFNREILLRNEKVYKAVIAEMEEGRRQIRANTQAVLSMLDRFDNAA